jgi:putative cyclase
MEVAVRRRRILMAIAGAGVMAIGLAPTASSRANAQAPASPPPVDPKVAARAVSIPYEQVIKMTTDLSNWGRWGKEDERGSLNLVTPQKTLQALKLSKDGVYVSLAHFAELTKQADNFNFGETKHWMSFVDPQTHKVRGALDNISFGIHDGTNSHLDSLCHYNIEKNGVALVFNGHPQNLDEVGCKQDAIDRMGPGIITRAVLVDMPLLKGVPYLEPGTPILASDLEAWEKFANVKIGSGDAVFVRSGRWARRAALGPWNSAREAAGLHASAMPWLKQRDIVLLGSDAVNDVQPSGVEGGVPGEAKNRPIHLLSIAIMGVPLVDNGYFEDAAREAAQRKRWDFLLTVQFTRVPGGTASTFNALAVF